MRGRGLGHALWVLAFGVALAPYRPPVRLDAPQAPTPVAQINLVETLFVDIEPPKTLSSGRRAAEATGHALLFVETFLADIPGVIPRVTGAPRFAGFDRALPPVDPPWTVRVAVDVSDENLTITLDVCDTIGACQVHRADGARLNANAPVARVIAEVAARMGRTPAVPVETWSAQATKDDYANLMAGRGAAILYGLYEPVPPEQRGDGRRDPIARAVFLDPRQIASWTVVARATESLDRRVLAWKFAADYAPLSPSLKASHATVLDDEGLLEPAWTAWTAVGALAPTDLRFVVPRARAALRVGQLGEVERLLTIIPQRYSEDPMLVSMNVAVADAKGGADDTLLAQWQRTDPTNAEPVRRRVADAIDRKDYAAALELTPELAARGASTEAWSIEIGLASDLGRYDVAARAAAQLQQPDLERRIRGRAAASPAERADLLVGVIRPSGRLARADALLAAGQAQEARQEVERLLKERPWWPEALDLLARSQVTLGQDKLASESRTRVLQADPLFYEAARP